MILNTRLEAGTGVSWRRAAFAEQTLVRERT
jgi:hypothetical protein